MDDDDLWAAVWLAWVAYFAIAETIAIKSRNEEAPLSHQLRRILGVKRQTTHRRLGQLTFGFGVWWIAQHLWREATSEDQVP